MVSKAFSMSREIIAVCSCLLKLVRIESVILHSCWMVECPFRKPNWSGLSTSLLSRNLSIWMRISFSRILLSVLSKDMGL